MISKSPERNTLQRDKYVERQTEKGAMDNPETYEMFEWYERVDQLRIEKEQDPAWQKNNLEYDLLTTDWILEKVRASDIYAQNLYAAMCNTDFIKNEVWPLLQEEKWSCSWRHAGGIVADMREKGDYMDWYCSGSYNEGSHNLSEGVVSDEIKEDMLSLGWIVVSY